MELEKDIERYLKKRTEEEGLLCIKLVSPGEKGVPDRIVITEHSIFFIELKRAQGKTSKLQKKWIEKLKAYNKKVLVISSKEEVDEFMQHEVWF